MCKNGMGKDKYEKLVLRLEDGEVETPWVVDLGNGRYRMDNCPFFYYGIAAGDIIGAEYSEEDDNLVFTKVLEKSGNKLVRIIFENSADNDSPENGHLDKLVEMGCSYEGADLRYICIHIPAEVDLFRVCDYLTQHEVLWEHAAPTYEELHPGEE